MAPVMLCVMTTIATELALLLNESDTTAVLAALGRRRVPLDEFAARCWPARAYGDWLDALGLDVLAQRARTVLPHETQLGRQFAALVAQHTIRPITVDYPGLTPRSV